MCAVSHALCSCMPPRAAVSDLLPPIHELMSFLADVFLAVNRRVAFSFLEDVKKRFQESHADKARTALAYAMNDEFSRVLSKQMEYYSQNGAQDKVDKVKEQMDDVKNVMVDNIEKVLKRGEKIELLVDKTDNLNQQSIRFKKHSTQLKQAMWWQNAKLMIVVGVVVVVVVGIIAYSMKK